MSLYDPASSSNPIIGLEFDAPEGKQSQIRSTVRLIARQLGDGVSTTLDDGTVKWEHKTVKIKLQPSSSGVVLTIHEDCSGLLRQAFWSGLGTGVVISLIVGLLPLTIPIGIVLASTGISNMLDDASNVAMAIKGVIALFVIPTTIRRNKKAVLNGLTHRREELKTLGRRCVEQLSKG